MSFRAWRRVPEAGACSFCLMLATRGAVYRTARTAGEANSYHRFCRCDAQLETDFDRRSDVAIDPADANQVLTFRNTKTRRTYTYDLRRYNLRNPPMVPAQPAVKQAAEEVIEWVDQIPAIEPEDLATAITRSNPLLSTGAREYSHNCTRAVVAGEMRCRGYDVTAGPALGDRGERVAAQVFDLRGKSLRKVKGGRLSSIVKELEQEIQLQRDLLSSLGREMPEATSPPRLWIQWIWKGRRAGHITMAEVRDGKLVILDPQIAQEIPLDTLTGRVSEVRWLRVDDLELTDVGALDFVVPG